MKAKHEFIHSDCWHFSDDKWVNEKQTIYHEEGKELLLGPEEILEDPEYDVSKCQLRDNNGTILTLYPRNESENHSKYRLSYKKCRTSIVTLSKEYEGAWEVIATISKPEGFSKKHKEHNVTTKMYPYEVKVRQVCIIQ